MASVLTRAELDEAVLDAIQVDRGTPVPRWLVIKRMLLAQFGSGAVVGIREKKEAQQAFIRMKMRGRIVEAPIPWGGLQRVRKDRWVENG